MKVKDLIEELKKQNPESEVMMPHPRDTRIGCAFPIGSVTGIIGRPPYWQMDAIMLMHEEDPA